MNPSGGEHNNRYPPYGHRPSPQQYRNNGGNNGQYGRDDIDSEAVSGAQGGGRYGELSPPLPRQRDNTGQSDQDGHDWYGTPRSGQQGLSNNTASATPSSILDVNRTPMASFTTNNAFMSRTNSNHSIGGRNVDARAQPPVPPLPAQPQRPYISDNNSVSSTRVPEAYPVHSAAPGRTTSPPAPAVVNNYAAAGGYPVVNRGASPAGYSRNGATSTPPYRHDEAGDYRHHEHYPKTKQSYPPSNDTHDRYNYQHSQQQHRQQPQHAYQDGRVGGFARSTPPARDGAYSPAGGRSGQPPAQYGHGGGPNNYPMKPPQPPPGYRPGGGGGSGNDRLNPPNTTAEQEGKSSQDVWDFPNGARPSRTNAVGATIGGTANVGASSGAVFDPTGPAYGKFKLERRCCGCRQKYCLIATFAICIVVGLLLFFAWPRLPNISVTGIDTTQAMQINMPGETPQDQATGMQGAWSVALNVENDNFIPWPYKVVSITVTDPNLLSNGKIGEGQLSNVKVPRGYSTLRVPVNINYAASNVTDRALQGMSNSCTNGQGLSVNMDIFFQMVGLTFFNKNTDVGSTYFCRQPQSS